MLHTVVQMSAFRKNAEHLGLNDTEIMEIIDYFMQNPMAGTVIKDTGGARKIRFAFKGKGKSGGARIISFYTGVNIPVFLLNIYAKNEKINISKSEATALKAILNAITEEYSKKQNE
jgi:hypothetical protein